MKKVLAASLLALFLGGCAGFDEEECLASAEQFMNERGGVAAQIPAERWKYYGYDSSGNVYYMEAMAFDHCDLTNAVQLREVK